MFTIRMAVGEDLPGILEIYNDAILHTTATFDLEEQTLEQRSVWFSHYNDRFPLLVAVANGRVAGYSSLSVFRTKPAYDRTAESSVYINREFRGQGIGEALMADILRKAHELGYHAVIAGITAGNEASVRLHEKLGFRLAGTFNQVGYKFGAWQDVLFYQLLLE